MLDKELSHLNFLPFISPLRVTFINFIKHRLAVVKRSNTNRKHIEKRSKKYLSLCVQCQVAANCGFNIQEWKRETIERINQQMKQTNETFWIKFSS